MEGVLGRGEWIALAGEVFQAVGIAWGCGWALVF